MIDLVRIGHHWSNSYPVFLPHFVFHDDERFQELKKKYYWHEAHVDPMAYKQAIRKLKGLTMNR